MTRLTGARTPKTRNPGAANAEVSDLCLAAQDRHKTYSKGSNVATVLGLTKARDGTSVWLWSPDRSLTSVGTYAANEAVAVAGRILRGLPDCSVFVAKGAVA